MLKAHMTINDCEQLFCILQNCQSIMSLLNHISQRLSHSVLCSQKNQTSKNLLFKDPFIKSCHKNGSVPLTIQDIAVLQHISSQLSGKAFERV